MAVHAVPQQARDAERWIKESKSAVKRTRVSRHDLVDNQVRLQLFALACNVGNFLRRLALPRSVQHWSLMTLREKLITIGAKVVHHVRYVMFQTVEVAVPQEQFVAILHGSSDCDSNRNWRVLDDGSECSKDRLKGWGPRLPSTPRVRQRLAIG